MSPSPPNLSFLQGGGQMGALIRAHDWSKTPLGRPETWPQALKTAIGLMLGARQPVYLAWGPQLHSFYNDGYLPIVGTKHPGLGLPFRQLWAEIWDEFRPYVEATMAGDAQHFVNLPIALGGRPGVPVGYFTFSYTALRDEHGEPAGFYCAATETTDQVLAERRSVEEASRQRRLFDKAPSFTCVLRGPDHVFEFVNEACTRLFGEREYVGRPIREVFRATEAQRMIETLDGAYASGQRFIADGIAMHLQPTPGGTARDVRLDYICEPIQDAAGQTTSLFLQGFDVTEAHRARGQLREIADRQTYLLELETSLRGVASARAALDVACEAIGRALGVSLVTFNQVTADRQHLDVISEWRAGPVPSTLGRHRLADWGEARIPDLLSGGVEQVEDIATDARTAGSAAEAAYAAVGCRASLNVPLVRDGQVRAMLAVGAASPRSWNAAEIALAQETVERAWHAAERVRAEAALRDAERNYRALFVSTPTPFLLLAPDPAHFTIIDVNDAYLAATMRTREQLVGRPMFEAFPDDPSDPHSAQGRTLRASLERALAQGRTDALSRLKYTIRRNDGSFEERWWDPVNTPLVDHDGKVVALLHHATDVTDTVRGEAALRESEARYRTLFENIDVGFAILALVRDAQGRPVDCRFLETNPAFEHQTGLRTVVGRLASEAMPGIGQAWFDRLGQVARSGASTRLEDIVEPLGRWYDVSIVRLETSDDGRVGVLFNDITERRSAERSLRELNETLEAQVALRAAERDRLWNLSQDMLARADYSGMMSAVSPAWRQVLGWSEAELLSRGYASFMHADDMPATLAAIGQMHDTRRPARFENRIATKDGGFKPIEWTVSPEPDSDNFIAVGRDLSATKAREAELRMAQDALRQSQKMEAMGQLTGGVAHDFNNLLAPIVGTLDILRLTGLGNEREQRLIAGALRSADRAKTLVQRLLAFARRQPLQPVPVDVARLVSGMGDLIASTTGPKVRVLVEAPDGLPPAQADPNQLEMALLNLSVNARDAMPDGGTLRISAGCERVEAGHRSQLAPGTYIRLAVADSGEGMDASTLARAVEPFFSTKGVGKGTGLGLSMVHGLASQLGGALAIQSEPGQGTVVELWLPLGTATLPVAASAQAPATERAGKGTALLVDDEELVRMSTTAMLGALGYAVVETGSAEEALRLLRRGDGFDLVVTDHLMPGMSGVELIRVARQLRPGLRVLLVSGYAEAEGVAADIPRLSKPFRQDELASSLEAINA